MSDPAGALVLTYHAIDGGPPPLSVDPGLFRRHLEALATASASVVTVAELGERLRSGELEPRTVAITFDDALGSVVEQAAPALEQFGYPATVFAISGHIGGHNDWATQPASVAPARLLDDGELRRLRDRGWEVGSHGHSHRPLTTLDRADALGELELSRSRLEAIVDAPVRSFAYPYGSTPDGARELLEAAGYDAGCTGRLRRVSSGTDPLTLPRVDAHYLRSVVRLEAAVRGSWLYLWARDVGRRARRIVEPDYVVERPGRAA